MASIICPTPVRQLWLHRPTNSDTSTTGGRWEVGFFDATGGWCPESAHADPGLAADRVHWLNGGHIDTEPDTDGQLDRADDEITRLQTQITRLTRDRDKWRNQALRQAHTRRANTRQGRGRGRRTPRGQR